MIAEEEELKKRLVKSIDCCRKELNTLCTELQLPPFEVQFLSRKCFCLSVGKIADTF